MSFIQDPKHEDQWQRGRRGMKLSDDSLWVTLFIIIILTLIVDNLS